MTPILMKATALLLAFTVATFAQSPYVPSEGDALYFHNGAWQRIVRATPTVPTLTGELRLYCETPVVLEALPWNVVTASFPYALDATLQFTVTATPAPAVSTVAKGDVAVQPR